MARGTPDERRSALVEPSDGSIVLHIFEELFQQLGHLDRTADALT